MLVPAPEGDVPEEVLRRAVLTGIADCADRIGGTSTSFAVPAWAKWARTMTDAKAAKGWPRVFADGRSLTSALASIWEGASPAGMTGGHLRDLTAEFLDQADALIGGTGPAAQAWRAAGQVWHEVAETALPDDVPEFARQRELTAAIQLSIIADGDAGAAEVAAAAEELWELRARLDAEPPLTPATRDDLFAALAARLRAAHDAERAAVSELAAIARR
jgi:hypothetical protein